MAFMIIFNEHGQSYYVHRNDCVWPKWPCFNSTNLRNRHCFRSVHLHIHKLKQERKLSINDQHWFHSMNKFIASSELQLLLCICIFLFLCVLNISKAISNNSCPCMFRDATTPQNHINRTCSLWSRQPRGSCQVYSASRGPATVSIHSGCKKHPAESEYE